MPERVKPKRVTLAKLATLLDLPAGVTVASVGCDDTTATVYLAGADSRRLSLADLASLLDMPSIGLIGTDGDEVVVFTKAAAEVAAPPLDSKKAGS